MDALNGLGNILGLEDLLEGTTTGFSAEVLGALQQAGFDMAHAYGFPNLQLSHEVLAALTPSVTELYPEEASELRETLASAAQSGCLVDLRLTEDTAFAPI